MKIKKEDEETEADFVIRRNRLVKEVAKEQGLWSHLYTKAVSNWASHIQRNHVGAWHGRLASTLTPLCLQTLRFLNADCRTHTRRLPGGFPARWCESTARAEEHLASLPKPAKKQRKQCGQKKPFGPSVIVKGTSLTYPLSRCKIVVF